MWFVIGIAAGAIVLLIAIVVVRGMLLPKAHVASCTREFSASIDETWRAIEDVAALPSWRKGITRVDVTDATLERRAWTEHSQHGAMPLRVTRRDSPRLLELRIDTDALPFGGTWTYELEPVSDRVARVTITERGFVKPAAFRFLGRFVFGFDRSIRTSLDELAAHLGGGAKV